MPREPSPYFLRSYFSKLGMDTCVLKGRDLNARPEYLRTGVGVGGDLPWWEGGEEGERRGHIMHCKKIVSGFPVASRDATYQTPPGRLGMGKPLTFFLQCGLNKDQLLFESHRREKNE